MSEDKKKLTGKDKDKIISFLKKENEKLRHEADGGGLEYKGESVDIIKNKDGTYTLIRVNYDVATRKANITSVEKLCDHEYQAIFEAKKIMINKVLGRIHE